METITFHCKVITPMFLAGADGQTPELRAPSIKGAMRFWWRACNGHLPLEEMRKKEEAIFGGTNTGGRSKVIIRVEPLALKIGQLPHGSHEKEKNPGIFYLWYTIPMNDNRKSIWEGQFKVTLTSFDKKALEEATLAFWLLSILGGIGTRSRRGAGNFQINSIDGTFKINGFSFRPNPTLPFKEYLKSNLDFVAVHFRFSRSFSPQEKTDFPMLKNAGIFIIDQKAPFALSALERIGRDYKEFRDRRNPDYDEIKSFISTGKTPQQIQRAEFGLPLSFRFRSLNHAGADIKTTDRSIDRSASSLLFHINEHKDVFFPVLTNFSSKLIPNSTNLKVSTPRRNLPQYSQQRAGIVNQPYQGIKETFLDTLKADII